MLQAYDQVRWGNWSRPDGTNTTWDNGLVPDNIKQEWDRKQRLRRLAQAERTRAVRIPGTLAVTDMMSFVRSQAVKEIVETRGTPNLREKMESVMRDTDPAVKTDSLASSDTPTTFRNLIQTVKRSLRQKSSAKPVSKGIKRFLLGASTLNFYRHAIDLTPVVKEEAQN